jgi:hypothetical protein
VIWLKAIVYRACQRIGELSGDLDKAEAHGGKIRLPDSRKPKKQALADAGLSTSTANEYEELAGGTTAEGRLGTSGRRNVHKLPISAPNEGSNSPRSARFPLGAGRPGGKIALAAAGSAEIANFNPQSGENTSDFACFPLGDALSQANAAGSRRRFKRAELRPTIVSSERYRHPRLGVRRSRGAAPWGRRPASPRGRLAPSYLLLCAIRTDLMRHVSGAPTAPQCILIERVAMLSLHIARMDILGRAWPRAINCRAWIRTAATDHEIRFILRPPAPRAERGVAWGGSASDGADTARRHHCLP